MEVNISVLLFLDNSLFHKSIEKHQQVNDCSSYLPVSLISNTFFSNHSCQLERNMLYSRVETFQNCQILQTPLNKLQKWFNRFNNLSLNPLNCTCSTVLFTESGNYKI